MSIMSLNDVEGLESNLDHLINRTIDSWTYVKVLQQEIEHLKSQFQDHDTGHLRTAVGVLENRVRDLRIQM